MIIRIYKLKNNPNVVFSGNSRSKNMFIVIEPFDAIYYTELVLILKTKYPNKFTKLQQELFSDKNNIVYTYYPFITTDIRDIKFNHGYQSDADISCLKMKLSKVSIGAGR